jgi:cytochrome c
MPPEGRQVIRSIVAATAAVLFGAGVANAQDPAAQRGFTFAKANCAMCHAIGPVGHSPLPLAPPFRTLHESYPVENLEEALAEGIVAGHPSMPQFQLDIARITDLIAYLKSLE